MRLLAFDVGGSHIAGALVEAPKFRLAARHSVPVDCHAPAPAFYDAVQQLCGVVLAEVGLQMSAVSGLCFGFPGPFDYTAGISLLEHKFEQLKGTNLRDDLSRRLLIAPGSIQFVNDADAFLLGELTQLPIEIEARSVGITLGTGVGSAFAISDRILTKGDGVPPSGEIWNLPWQGGIVEDAISTPAIVADYKSLAGVKLTVKEIAARCPADNLAVQVLQEFGARLGRALQAVTKPFHPDRIIFGGAISRSADLFLPFTSEVLGSTVELRVSTLFEAAALFGAAAHWIQASEPQSNLHSE